MKYLLFLSACLFNCFVTQAQIDLNYFITQAEKNSAIIHEKENLISIARLEQERLRKELAGLHIYATADYLLAPYFNNSHFVDVAPSPNAIGYDPGITNGGLYSALINIEQPLFTGKLLKAHLETQKIRQRQASFDKSLANLEIIKNVTDQYINVYRDQELLLMNKELLSIIEDQQLIIDQLARSGIMRRSDALLINLEKKNQQASIAMLESQKKQDLLDLYSLAGIADSFSVTLEKPNILIQDKELSSSHFLTQYAADSLAIIADDMVFESKYQPQVNVFGNAGINAVTLNNIERRVGYSMGAGVKLPIYDGHQVNINKQKEELSLNSLARHKIMKTVEIKNNLIKHKSAIEGLEKSISLLDSQINDYQELIEQYKAEIRAGQLSVVDYINSLKSYRQVQIELINSHSELMKKKNAYNYWNW